MIPTELQVLKGDERYLGAFLSLKMTQYAGSITVYSGLQGIQSSPLQPPTYRPTAVMDLWQVGQRKYNDEGREKAHYLLPSFVALWEVFKKVVTGPA